MKHEVNLKNTSFSGRTNILEHQQHGLVAQAGGGGRAPHTAPNLLYRRICRLYLVTQAQGWKSCQYSSRTVRVGLI